MAIEHTFPSVPTTAMWSSGLLSLIPIAILAKFVISIIYNIFFHPLRSFPGPTIAAATTIPYARRLVNGRMPEWITGLHKQYGEVVRIHPDEVSFIGSSAWKDIYNSYPALPKPEFGTAPSPNGVRPMMTTNTEDHDRQRRIISHAFSTAALKEQEVLVGHYADLLVQRLRERVAKGEDTVDILRWYQYATFDIIGDLCFGESFNCLEKGENHPWIATIYRNIKIAKIIGTLQCFPPMESLMHAVMPTSVRLKMRKTFTWSQNMITKRLERDTERNDIMTHVLNNNHKQGMTRDEIDSTMATMVLAGSGDTTAVAIAATTYFALKNPAIMNQLVTEIVQGLGDDPKDCTNEAISKLPLLHATVQESIRMHPPVPLSPPRLIDRPGAQICGVSVPAGYRAGVAAKTGNLHPSKWTDSDTFHPERWLPDAPSRYANDDRDFLQPFNVGPRNCLGKSLAWAEINLIFAKTVLAFDMEWSERNKEVGEWTDQKTYMLNEKKPLYVKLIPRSASEGK
ncbi:cytochrome P450 [Usnea florida]